MHLWAIQFDFLNLDLIFKLVEGKKDVNNKRSDFIQIELRKALKDWRSFHFHPLKNGDIFLFIRFCSIIVIENLQRRKGGRFYREDENTILGSKSFLIIPRSIIWLILSMITIYISFNSKFFLKHIYVKNSSQLSSSPNLTFLFPSQKLWLNGKDILGFASQASSFSLFLRLLTKSIKCL